MTAQVFDTVLRKSERERVHIEIPFAPGEVWGEQPRYSVSGRLNGTSFHGTLEMSDGRYYLPVDKTLQTKASLKVGDAVTVTIKRAKPQEAKLPDALAAALEQNPTARAFFDGLTVFERNRYVEWVAEAKGAARNERIEVTVENLTAGQKQR